jgi:hypothetical protein
LVDPVPEDLQLGLVGQPAFGGAAQPRRCLDEIVPPGTDIGTLDQAYAPPAIQKTELRRRTLSERSAA